MENTFNAISIAENFAQVLVDFHAETGLLRGEFVVYEDDTSGGVTIVQHIVIPTELNSDTTITALKKHLKKHSFYLNELKDCHYSNADGNHFIIRVRG